jgi:hypothetical protein
MSLGEKIISESRILAYLQEAQTIHLKVMEFWFQ